MTVAYAYFRYLVDSENHNSLIYYIGGASDDQLIDEESPGREVCDEMGKADKTVGEELEVKDAEGSAGDGNVEETRRRRLPNLKNIHTSNCCEMFVKVIYIVLIIIAILVCLAVIVVSVLTCIATKVYDKEQSSRLVGMVILAVTSAVAISMCIYAAIAIFKKQTRPIHATTVALFILVIIQALIIGVAVKVTERDEIILGQSLAESFRLAREDNPRHVKLWTATQSDLHCCGVYGPEDYRTPSIPQYFPPNVPISCCPTYNKDRSALVQEKDREVCKIRKTFYDVGCRRLVVNVFKETADVMFSVAITLIFIEILIALIGGCFLCKKQNLRANEEELQIADAKK